MPTHDGFTYCHNGSDCTNELHITATPIFQRMIDIDGDEFWDYRKLINSMPIVKDFHPYDSRLDIVNIIYNDPATIVFWANGEKTVVKCQPGQEFNPYYGLCAAVTKRVLGSNSSINALVNHFYELSTKENKKNG